MSCSGETPRAADYNENHQDHAKRAENSSLASARGPMTHLRNDGDKHIKEGDEKRSIEEVLASASLAPAQSLWTTEASGSVWLRIDETCPEEPITVHQMFRASVEMYGDLSALATKKKDKWEKITFAEYYHCCRTAAKSFLKLGLERFHSVAILGFNSAEWFFSAIGAIFAGGIMTGVYATNSPEACLYVVKDSRANIIVVENQKQLDKILQIKNMLPHLKAIVQYQGPLEKKLPNLYSWEEFMELGLDVPDKELDDIIAVQKVNQCCVLIYTSGTTGMPKGVMLSHDNITWTAHHASRAGDMQPADTKQESLVSYLPLSHIAAQISDLWTGIQWGKLVYFAQPDALKGSLISTLREVSPSSHMGVPRVWEKMMEKIKEGIAQSGYVKKKLVTWAMSVSLEANQNWANKNEDKPFVFLLADGLVLQKLRGELGFSRCLKFFSGAAPITSETVEFFLGLDILLYEVYGMSESTGPHLISGSKAYRLHRVVPGCKFKLADTLADADAEGAGEVCLWGRNVFMGFLNMEDKTREAMDEDGWLRSGDLGKADKDNFLYITGRIKELIITAGGENVPPVPIEDAVKKELPIISNAVLIGDKRKFLSMLLTLKPVVYDDSPQPSPSPYPRSGRQFPLPQGTGHTLIWQDQVRGSLILESMEPTDELSLEAVGYCQQLGSQATKVSHIVRGRDKEVYQSIQEGIDHVNRRAASNAQRIQKWAVLGRDFSISGGELGPTMKLRRPVVLEMYRKEIESFYAD